MYLKINVCTPVLVSGMCVVRTVLPGTTPGPGYTYLYTVVQEYKLKEELIFDYFFFIYFGLTVPVCVVYYRTEIEHKMAHKLNTSIAIGHV